MKLIWNEALGLDECPYLRRWVIETRWGSVRLHRWYASDDDRAFHDHPWAFHTFVIRGGYNDEHPCPTCMIEGKNYPIAYQTGKKPIRCPECFGFGNTYELVKAPAHRFRPAHHKHTVHVHRGGATTLMLTGPIVRPWGFWVKKANGKPKFLEHRRYFHKFGHHPCATGDMSAIGRHIAQGGVDWEHAARIDWGDE